MKKTVIILSLMFPLLGSSAKKPVNVGIELSYAYSEMGGCNPCQNSKTGEYFFYSNREVQFIVSGLKPEKKPVKTLVLPIGEGVKVGEKHSFRFGRKTYTFRAEGTFGIGYHDEYWYKIKDYKLYLSDEKNEQLITTVSEFYSTSPEILWVGDLDRDGKPDFVVRTRTWYEDERIELYLSSIAGKGELVKFASEATYSRPDEDE
jgi:hypothetical protein